MTFAFRIIHVCVTGKQTKSVIPSNRVRSTATLPSSGPGINHEKNGFTVRFPAMIPTSYNGGERRCKMPPSDVPNSLPAGPFTQR